MHPITRSLAAALVAGFVLAAAPARGADRPAFLEPCRLDGVEHEALCGVVQRPLDATRPEGQAIGIHVAVLPALSRRPLPDPVFVFAGGPGQSAIDLAGPMSRLLARTLNRRDVVLVDQRGTGRSAPLHCPDAGRTAPLAHSLDSARQSERLARCRESLQSLPYGDLRQFSTPTAVHDFEAVRRALGADAVNVLAISYGTRAALEFIRQFPASARRVVLDGVVPPDMSLPASASGDSQAALDALFAQCEADARCSTRHPDLRARWRSWLAALPRTVTLAHPFTGQPETVQLTREAALSLVRAPLYLPALGSGLPEALAEASADRPAALAALAASLAHGGSRGMPALAEGMHYSVVCSEDMSLPGDGTAGPPGADFGNVLLDAYRRACTGWPRAALPEGFRRIGPASSPVMLLSGGRDPATPPRHAERVAAALGPLARHFVAPNAAHGVIALPCTRDLLHAFFDARDNADALAVDAACLHVVPSPRAFVPPRPGGAK